MKNDGAKRVLFVTADYTLESPGGGVQRCTREYLSVIRAAGFDPEILTYSIDRRPFTRLRRLLAPRPYANLIPEGFAEEITSAGKQRATSWILLNQTEAGPLATSLHALRGNGVRIALLSHGSDSADYLHNVRISRELRTVTGPRRRTIEWLGRQLFAEMEFHRSCDVVFCLSETDREIAHWLGAPSVHLLPRVVESEPQPWTPVAGRIGMVSTLNHGPNYEGIELACRALASHGTPPLRLRIVGRPPEVGRALAARFPFIDYLGSLDDAQLAAEARSWCAFANPIFCYPRGCSTKLAVPLGWRLPIVTSRAGARGYAWDETLVPLLDTPEAFAAEAIRLASPLAAAEARVAVSTLADRSPTLARLADQVRSALR